MENESTAHLPGTWKLLSCSLRVVSDDGIETFRVGPFGKDPQGRITMTSEGYFSVLSTSAEATTKGNISKWSLARDEDIANVARQMVTYCGPYRTYQDGDNLILSISVEVALDPNIIGTAMERICSIRTTEDSKVQMTLKGREQHTMIVSRNL